jgi:hypothetical protein
MINYKNTNGKMYKKMSPQEKKEHCKYRYKKYLKRYKHNKRKKLLIMFGGKCSQCGYDKNMHNLCFHHQDPNLKKFIISSRGIHVKWQNLIKEANKCVVLCHHCHNDLHLPNGLDWKKEDFYSLK